MKKIVFGCIFSLMLLAAGAQDIKAVKKSTDKKDFATAKTQIDAFLAKTPASAEGLWYKAFIYTSLPATPESRKEAFDAFQKAIATGATQKEYMILQALQGQNFYKPIFDLYTGYYDEAASKFNSAAGTGNKEDFKKAYDEFLNANNVGSYIAKNKWALTELDTALVLNLGKAALNAGMETEAIIAFKQLADANVTGTAAGKSGFDLPYQWLTLNYKKTKDEANLLKYSGLGQQYFPEDDYFDAVLIDWYREKKDKDAMFKQYQKIVTKFPDSVMYHFNYANELFNHIYNADEGTKISDREALLQTINTELTKAITMKPDDVNTNWLYGQYYYNQGIDLREVARAVKGSKPEDVKKRNEIVAQSTVSFNKAIPYAEKAMNTLEAGTKKSDKSRYKSIVNLLTEIYKATLKPDMVKKFEAKYDAADGLFVK